MHLSQLVIKVHDLCNLRCDYCYVYSDDAYVPSRSKSISESALHARLCEIVQRAEAGLIQVNSALEVTLHGGEPTLIGLDGIQRVIGIVRDTLLIVAPRLRISMTTNGVLFDRNWAAFFAKNSDLGLAISHDGLKNVHDSHRGTIKGNGSYESATMAITEALAHGLDPFVLSVVDVESDPQETLDHLFKIGVRRMDLLLPETKGQLGIRKPVPGALECYLLEAFNHWSTSHCGFMRVRIFDTVIARLLGKETNNCTLGPGCAGIITVHSDGDISGCDVLGSKAAPGRESSTGDSSWNKFEQELSLSAYGRSQGKLAALSKPKPCQGCKYWAQCGGYCLATRLDEAGVDDPKVTTPHCGALYALFTAAERHLRRTMPSIRFGIISSDRPTIPITIL